MKKLRLRREVILTVGLLLIAIALLLTGKNFYTSYRAGKSAEEALAVLEKETSSVEHIEDSPSYVKNPEKEMPSLMVGDREYIGVLSIPALNLTLAVQRDWSEENTKITPACYIGSAYLNNMVICAHNYTTHFGRLNELKEGDIVTFKDIDSNLFTYKVIGTELIDGNDVDGMISGDWDLTLFTCTVDASKRVTVRCRLVTE